MEPKNCKRCGRMFAYNGGLPICDQCKRKDEEDFEKVRLYIKENKGANLKEVSEACDVTVEKITRFLREGRLEVREGSAISLQCEDCGKLIKKGRFCDECSKKLEKEFSKVAGISQSKDGEDGSECNSRRGGGLRYLKTD